MLTKDKSIQIRLDDAHLRAYRTVAYRDEKQFSEWVREALDRHVAYTWEKLTGKPIEIQRAETARERNAQARVVIDQIIAKARDARVPVTQLADLAETIRSRNPALTRFKANGRVVELALAVVKARIAQRLSDCDATRAGVDEAMGQLEHTVSSVRRAVAAIEAERRRGDAARPN